MYRARIIRRKRQKCHKSVKRRSEISSLACARTVTDMLGSFPLRPIPTTRNVSARDTNLISFSLCFAFKRPTSESSGCGSFRYDARHQLTRLGRSRHKSCISQLLFHVCWRFLSKRCLIFAGFLLSWDMRWYKLVNHLDAGKSIEHLKTFRINVVRKSTYHDLPTLSNQIADWAIRSPQRFCHAIK